MHRTSPPSFGRSLAAVVTAALLAACTDAAPLAPERRPEPPRLSAAQSDDAIVALRRATARYHDLDAAIADGFVFLHGCETRGEEGPVGILYVQFGRLLDGRLDPSAPDGLLYAPGPDGRPQLVAVELAVPYALWTGAQPPRFLGATFQREDEFGVFGLHVWLWRDNPAGLFAESNPRVSCGAA